MSQKVSKEQLDDAQHKLRHCDYIRFTWADLHGIHRSCVVPQRNLAHMLENGLAAYCGFVAMGPRTEVVVPEDVKAEAYDNMVVRPRLDAAHALPWADDEEFKIGEILCNCFWKDGRPQKPCPQNATLAQIEKLKSLGYRFYSAYEMEFNLCKGKSTEPVFLGNDMNTNLLHAEFQKYLLKLDSSLAAAGVDMECIHAEWGPGQFEMSMVPQWGIKAADNAFIFKQAAKEIALKMGYNAMFMSKPTEAHGSTGIHLTFSLWDDKGRNVFSGPDEKLSDVGKHFLAGLCEHGTALAAIFGPTVNCYRRYHEFLTARSICWGKGNRMAAFRVKEYGPYGACIENRMPSGAVNVYLAMAATIAAGIDGMQRKLELQPESNLEGTNGGRVPETLQEALEALQQDAILVEALDKQLVDWFVQCKKEAEIAVLPNFKRDVYDKESTDKELELYGKFI